MWIATARGPAVFRDGAVKQMPDVPAAASPSQSSRSAKIARISFTRRRKTMRPRCTARTRSIGTRTVCCGSARSAKACDSLTATRSSAFRSSTDLFDDVIYGITEDDQGRLWMACSKGIFSVSRSDLQQFAAGKIRQLCQHALQPARRASHESSASRACSRRSHGCGTAGCGSPPSAACWCSIRSHFERRFVPPAVIVEDVIVNGARRIAGDIGTLPAGANNVEFEYTRARASSRRRGFRSATCWKDSTRRGSRPGRGARRSIRTCRPDASVSVWPACTPDGACNESASVVAFAIAPKFYQRSLVLSLCARPGIALAGGAVYQLRIRRLKEQFDLILAERGRIARELHDTLIQGFSGITMAMQAMASRLPSSSNERHDARRHRRRRRQRDERSTTIARRTEAPRFIIGTRRRRRAGGASADGDQPRSPEAQSRRLPMRPLPPDVEYNLLRIAQEAVLNAVKHSGARTLQVTLDSTPRRLELSVKDDGAGFDDRRIVRRPATTASSG